MNKLLIKNKKRGFILPMVIIFMTIASVLLAAALQMGSTNAKISLDQYDITRAHYAAVSGVELAYGALFTDGAAMFTGYKNAALNRIALNQDPTKSESPATIYIDGQPVLVTMKLIRKGVYQSLDNYYIHIEAISKIAGADDYRILCDVSVYDPALVWHKPDQN